MKKFHTLKIGEVQEEAPDAGSVTVETRTPNGSTAARTLTPASAGVAADRLDLFGAAVARSGDTLAVGSPGDDTAGPDEGAVQVFALVDGDWRPAATPAAASPAEGALFGSAVSLHNGLLVIGAPFAPNGGSAEVFVDDGGGFVRVATLAEPAITGPAARFGEAVAVDADRIVIGAPAASARGPFAGEAFVYARSGDAVSTAARFQPPTGAPGDLFGIAVDVEGELAVVGARGADADAPNAGLARVFRLGPTGQPSFEANLTAPTPHADRALGAAVDIDSGRIALGGPGDAGAGLVAVFADTGAGWTVVGRVEDARAGFGRSVAFDGPDLLVGFGSAAGSGVVAVLDIAPGVPFDTSAPAPLRTPRAGVDPCRAAALAPPAGLLDTADAAAFADLYARLDPAADLNADGRVDVDDIDAFDRAASSCP